MEKQRLFKMGMLEKFSGQRHSATHKNHPDRKPPAQVQGLIDKTVNAPKGKLYLSDTEFQYAAQSLNGMRNAYLSAGRSSGGIDRVLAKLMSSKYPERAGSIRFKVARYPGTCGNAFHRLQGFFYFDLKKGRIFFDSIVKQKNPWWVWLLPYPIV